MRTTVPPAAEVADRNQPPTADDLFTAVYREYAPMVRRIILSKLARADYDLADDLTQNTFLALFRYRNRLDLDRDPGGLLNVMAKQSVSHHFRAMRNTREVPSDTGHWRFANRAFNPTAAGTLAPVTAAPGTDSDPNMDEALRRARTARIGGAR
jgi:DNA-directed RNA polymerase specialized sigma24 family protein